MKLRALAAALPRHTLIGDGDVEIGDIAFDSRSVGGGALFVCLEGLASDGHDFAAAAVNAGAAALVTRRSVDADPAVPRVQVPDTREALALLSAAFFAHPSLALDLFGVTGTNGKTSVAHLVRLIGEAAGRRAAVFGTLGNWLGGARRAASHTTPEAPVVQRLLREALDGGITWVAMEVSSHALAQKRTYGTDFAVVVFTNLTRDHLDYHGDLRAYFEAKALLFTPEGRGSRREVTAVLGTDDPAGRELFARIAGPKVSFGLSHDADYRAVDVETTGRGVSFRLVSPRGAIDVTSPLLGEFNVLNLLAAVAASAERGVPLAVAASAVATAPRVPGRMEIVPGNQPFLVIVDYAHTPDGLERALRAARGFTRGRLTVVFGCGGDRDRGKRPEMGRVAASLADRVVVTSDNPRTEDPDAILDAILAGMPDPAAARRERDRAAAIGLAIDGAEAGDTVLIAGKGHETVQIIGREERPFDDREVAAAALRRRG